MEWVIGGFVVWVIYRVVTIDSRRHKYFMEAIILKTGGVVGTGVVDIHKAVYLFNKASKLGHAQASFELGAIYEDGWSHPTSSRSNDQIAPNEALSRAYFEKCHTQSPDVFIQLKADRKKAHENIKKYLQGMTETTKEDSRGDNDKTTFNL